MCEVVIPAAKKIKQGKVIKTDGGRQYYFT